MAAAPRSSASQIREAGVARADASYDEVASWSAGPRALDAQGCGW